MTGPHLEMVETRLRPQLDLGEVIRSCGDAFLDQYGAGLTPEQRRALDDLARCRTAALGGHVLECPECGHRQIAYNSCRNRHCPKCQGTAAARWLEAQAADLLPVPYFHVVFTLPAAFNGLALENPRVVYDLLLRTAAETLLEVAADPKHLGARIGILSVLHTWGQNLQLHPHVHCVVPGGGLSPDSSRWIGCSPDFLLPVRVLSRVFRGKFLAGLRRAFAQGQLRFASAGADWAGAESLESLLSQAAQTDWVVYAKPPFGGPEQVLKYLARYTHRVALSNSRLLGFEQGQVSFGWKDYAHNGCQRTMTLSAIELVRRFLMHVLPAGFVRIRHYGLLSHRNRREQVALCRKLLEPSRSSGSDVPELVPRPDGVSAVTATKVCPVCGAGRMIVVEEFPPWAIGPPAPAGSVWNRTWDSS
jgi:putative transposase/transposase-like zinc-binding protein